MTYDELLQVADDEGVSVVDFSFTDNLTGLYVDNVVLLDKKASTKEKKCILAEELGHHYTNYGNVLQDTRQESIARRWGIDQLIPFEDLVTSIIGGCDSMYELAEHLDVTIPYLEEAVRYYHAKYGATIVTDGFVIHLSDSSIIVHPELI